MEAPGVTPRTACSTNCDVAVPASSNDVQRIALPIHQNKTRRVTRTPRRASEPWHSLCTRISIRDFVSFPLGAGVTPPVGILNGRRLLFSVRVCRIGCPNRTAPDTQTPRPPGRARRTRRCADSLIGRNPKDLRQLVEGAASLLSSFGLAHCVQLAARDDVGLDGVRLCEERACALCGDHPEYSSAFEMRS